MTTHSCPFSHVYSVLTNRQQTLTCINSFDKLFSNQDTVLYGKSYVLTLATKDNDSLVHKHSWVEIPGQGHSIQVKTMRKLFLSPFVCLHIEGKHFSCVVEGVSPDNSATLSSTDNSLWWTITCTCTSDKSIVYMCTCLDAHFYTTCLKITCLVGTRSISSHPWTSSALG